MNKYFNELIVLMIASTLSSSIWGAEFVESKFSGMHLAWAKVPSGKTDGSQTVSPEPKPKAKPKQQAVKPAVSTPVSPAVTMPVPVTVVPAPRTVVKPEVVPIVTPKLQPVIKSAPSPVIKPTQVHVDKPAPSLDRKEPMAVEWLVGIGIDMGGEVLGTVTYSDGSTAPVNANSGIVFNAGGIVKQGNNNPFSTQFSIGYKSGGPKIWNKDVNWTVIPIEVMGNYQSGSVRFGLGISYQLNPQLKVDLPSSSSVSKYNNALGYVAQISWVPAREHYSVDLRYTSIKFQSSDVSGAPLIDGSVTGVRATFYY